MIADASDGEPLITPTQAEVAAFATAGR